MKEKIIVDIIYFVIAYILVLLVYILFINKKRKTYKDGKKQTEINYLVKKFKLDLRVTKYNTVKWAVTLTNSFIIASTFVLVNNVPSFTLSLIIGFITMIILVYVIYEILGRSLKRKEMKKHV